MRRTPLGRKPYPKDAVSKVIDDALRQQKRQRRTKYEIALDALLRVHGEFDGTDAVAIEDALAALRGRIDAADDRPIRVKDTSKFPPRETA